ncbi:SRPBCC family protein [Neptunicoccus sediminis]|uniref:SRPBCC family protein n=1 Tax=Neptunicoccus sediminis TaxID=1892596 RepID=UPI0008461EFF|nr:SRPBCC family protein [Neptunicoccus sediminis]
MSNQEIKATAKMLIRRPVDEVFEAFVNPDQMTKFWFPKSSGRLEEGATVEWQVGTSDDDPKIDVKVVNFEKDARLDIQWTAGEKSTRVEWKFTPQSDGTTFLEIVESGFEGSLEEVAAKAVDSTGGFNQVIVAAKAMLEHGVKINVVKDHAPNGC